MDKDDKKHAQNSKDPNIRKPEKNIRNPDTPENNDLPGYPPYPASEDMYIAGTEESNVSPEDTSKEKPGNPDPLTANEKSFQQDKSGRDLDVPGAELDDDMEDYGSEDEENNSYSLGGDKHD